MPLTSEKGIQSLKDSSSVLSLFASSMSNHVPTADNVEFGRNTMCHFLSSFFRSLTRGLEAREIIFKNFNFLLCSDRCSTREIF